LISREVGCDPRMNRNYSVATNTVMKREISKASQKREAV